MKRNGEGVINLLPACPSAWTKGSIEGLSLRGGIHIDHLSWDGDKVSVTLTSKRPRTVTITVRGQNPQTITLQSGKNTFGSGNI